VSLFDQPGPRWRTIPAHRDFLADLARGLLDELSGLGPEELSDAVILVPSRRGARALAEAFLEASRPRAVLLPQIRALGDLDEGEPPFEPGDLALDLDPAVGAYRRRFELARLVGEHSALFDRSLDASGALELADALGAFLDSVELEEAQARDHVAGLVEGDLARHWQVSAQFLAIALDAWPARLAELGLLDPGARRVRLLRALAEKWTRTPPQGVMIAAGSTGTAPANADLLAVIAGLPKGAVVLPGLDLELADDAWAEVGEQHPQGAMKRLIARAGVSRSGVLVWPRSELAGEGAGRWRRRIINEALRPPDSTADWITQIGKIRDEGKKQGVDPIAEGLDGLSVVAARSEEEAAACAALLMREALETPGRTCALITPDQALARRVSARLARWGLQVDSSAGCPLAQYQVAVLAGLVARAVADAADPVTLLAILKHPMVRLGWEFDALRHARRTLEKRALRGPRPAGWDGVVRTLEEAALDRDGQPRPEEELAALAQAHGLLDALRRALALAVAPITGGTVTPSEAARGLVQAMEALAADAEGASGDLWAGPAGEAMVGLFNALMQESDGLPEATPAQFADLLDTLMQGETVRAQGGAHPRLKILGAIEARLIGADRLILAGLEEGVWPQGAPIDPFLSRPMREKLGLPPPERRIGLSAHDFAQAASAGEVVLLHTERRDGAPAVQSRWLWRLRTLARGAGVDLPERTEITAWARGLDAPSAFEPAKRPRPTPPLAARPRNLPVTGVETWVRDPYAVYARYVLKLRQMERPDEQIEARARGVAVHRAIEQFSLAHPEILPPSAADIFAGLLVAALEDAGMGRSAMVRERSLVARLAPWIEALERRRRPGAQLMVEQQGRVTLETAGGAFVLTARADRLEVRAGGVDILDFKTGQAPSKKQVQSGLSPQLTLTGAILNLGGFAAIGKARPGELAYVRLSGGRKAGEEIVAAPPEDSLDWSLAALDGLLRRIDRFDDEATPYLSWALPQFINERGGDYDHLARLWEWHVIGEAEGGEGAP
jgi:ATP-dependent helicase/nuclease subunit B